MPNDGQPQAEATELACARIIGLAEAFEDMRQELGVDPYAGVADCDLGVRINPFEPDLYLPPLGCELDRVRQEIPDHLLEAARVAGDRPRARIQHYLDPHALGFRGR